MLPLIEPDWDLPGVTAFSTLRSGGCSAAPWDSFNLGGHVGDAPASVARNRARLVTRLPTGSTIQWLQQVHGKRVIRAQGGAPPEADACWSDQPAMACAVMTADCLPVLFASRDGRVVAAAHAGWKGLLQGVLEAAVAAMQVEPMQIIAWMGPAIGPQAFEVGPEVREAFVAAGDDAAAFLPSARQGHYLADIYALARNRLLAAGVSEISGGGHCTFREAGRFFSYRRDGVTGRMASLICINP